MKPYFAKYLPVEGEIKEGDIYTCKHKGKGIDVGFGMPEQVKVIMKYDKRRNLCSDCTKIKLFLCSRDIQVGDNVWDSNHLLEPWGMLTVSDMKRNDNHHFFKVFGEISPEATWVKEGDEFEESEVQQGSCKMLQGRNLVVSFKGASQEELDQWKPNNGFEKCYLIKGQCGHFH